MSIRVALTGPMYSGKTTLANYLEREHGFININYSRTLKELACDMLNAINYAEFARLHDEVEVEDIEANKPKYRAFLQEIGTLCGFDHGGFVDKVCATLDRYPAANAVFDNVRFLPQFEKLKAKGFTLVRFVDPHNITMTRGVATRAQAEHVAEAGVPAQENELLLEVGEPVEAHIAQILTLEVL